jgi:two-component system sensor histidine kinase UhpB
MIDKELRILAIEDNDGDFILVEEYIKEFLPRASITHSMSIAGAIISLNTHSYDVVLLDLSLPDSKGQETIKKMITLAGSTPVIVLTGLNDKQVGIESLKLGVQDYLVKGEVNSSTLLKSISYSIQRKKTEEQLKLSEEKYRYLFNNNPESIFIVEKKSLQILDVNETAIKKYGYDKEAFFQLNMLDLVPESEYLNTPSLFIEKINLANLSNIVATWPQLKKNGELIFVHFSLHEIEYSNNKAILAIGSDITEKLMLEKQLADEQQKRQQEITEAVISAQEKERSQLANELHDNINQLLSTTRLYVECAITNETLRPRLLVDSKDYIISAIAELRKLSKTLLPPSLGEVGLIDAVVDLIQGIKKVNDINFKTDFDSFLERDSDEKLKLSIFRIVQEQINNTIKHANARNVFIGISQTQLEVKLLITDDGIGFDTTVKHDGLGLKNIATRAAVHNGKLLLESSPGNGCSLSIQFPLASSKTM